MVVLERLHIAWNTQHVDLGERIDLGHDAGLLRQPLHLAQRQLRGQRGAPRLDQRDAGRGLGHDLEDDLLDAGLAAPVLVESLHHDARTALVLDHAIRAGADRLGVEAVRPDLRHVGFGHDVHRQEGQVDRCCRRRAAEHDHALGRRLHLDLGQRVEHAADQQLLVGLGTVGQAVLDVFHRQLAAVVEQDVVAQRDLEPGCLVVDPLPFLDLARLQLEVGRIPQWRIEHGLVHALDGRDGHGARVPGRDVHRIGDRQAVLVGDLRLGHLPRQQGAGAGAQGTQQQLAPARVVRRETRVDFGQKDRAWGRVVHGAVLSKSEVVRGRRFADRSAVAAVRSGLRCGSGRI